MITSKFQFSRDKKKTLDCVGGKSYRGFTAGTVAYAQAKLLQCCVILHFPKKYFCFFVYHQIWRLC